MIYEQTEVDRDLDIIEVDSPNIETQLLKECPLCLKFVKQSLETHFNLEHKELECSFCGQIFGNEHILNEHINKTHLDSDFSQQEIKGMKNNLQYL